MGYGLINSPFKLFTGRSLSGSVQLPQEKFEAFLDVLPTAFLKGIKYLGLCGKVSSGLQGYNSFIKSKQYKLNKASGKGWQKKPANNSSKPGTIMTCTKPVKSFGGILMMELLFGMNIQKKENE